MTTIDGQPGTERPERARREWVMTPELFVVPDERSPLLYAPLKGLVFRVRPALVTRLEAARSCGRPLHDADPALFRLLDDMGVLDRADTPMSFPERTVDDDFSPTGVVLLLTSACNLRCRYCYADGGERAEPRFSTELASAAIRLVVDNAQRRGEELAHLAFHGGGEPTRDFACLRESVHFARSYAREKTGGRVRVETSLVTNGVMPVSRAEWIAGNFDTVQMSLDGPAALHDLQRPLPGGGSSHRIALRTARILEAQLPDLLIKATISAGAVPRMAEVAQFLCTTFQLLRFHLGPVLDDGRARGSSDYGQPDAEAFVAGFLQAQAVADRYGRQIVVSGAQATFPRLRSTYCGVTDPNFVVTARGLVTSCYGVMYSDDLRADRFHYGRFDCAAGRFEVDREKILQLRRADVSTVSRCTDCFAKWHCAADCRARFDGADSSAPEPDVRCGINRLLIRRRLYEHVPVG